MCSTPKCLHRFWVYSNRSLWKVLSRLVCILLDNKLVAGKIPRPKLSSSCRTNNPRIVARTALKGGGLRSSRGQQSMPAQIQKVCAQIACIFIAFKKGRLQLSIGPLGRSYPALWRASARSKATNYLMTLYQYVCIPDFSKYMGQVLCTISIVRELRSMNVRIALVSNTDSRMSKSGWHKYYRRLIALLNRSGSAGPWCSIIPQPHRA